MRASYKDKYGPLGMIAVLAGRVEGTTVRVETWVMSCRAFSRRVEHQCLAELFRRFGADVVALGFQPTDRNQPLQEFLTSFGEGTPPSRAQITREMFQSACPRLHHRLNPTST
jgi:predicted enzyme involved in methoxymalonyl-ACP biosynthesis